MPSHLCDIGVIGLAVMGQNLVLNMNDHGYKVCVFNRTVSKVHEFLQNEAKGTKIQGANSLEELISLLEPPKVVMLMVKAGSPVDSFIEALVPLLSTGDIIIDGGNSDYLDTTRRCKALADKGILYVGSGVSGGEEGARTGPSLMPGGNKDAWSRVKPIFQDIAAKANDSLSCCNWMGADGAGHFVKMVHNGIEYGDMQLIAEAYHLLKEIGGFDSDCISKIFKEWNTGELDSFLIEITANIFSYKDEDKEPLIEKILDQAGQKGTGRWTVNYGLELGCAITLIAESVFSRYISAMKDVRLEAAKLLKGPDTVILSKEEKANFVKDVHQAVFASKIISYAQGFLMFQHAKKQYGWELDFGQIASIWRGGCIIRSQFLENIKKAFDENPNISNLLLAPFFSKIVQECDSGWRRVTVKAINSGIPVPALSSALSFYDSIRCPRLPANLVQAQRDFFGAHQYELISNPGTFVHTNWTGKGGSATSTAYQV